MDKLAEREQDRVGAVREPPLPGAAIRLNCVTPTIRVNGSDIQLESKESHCTPCSTIGGIDTDCRIWLYQGQEYEAPPTAMLVDALLREVCDSAGARPPRPPIPDSARANLKRFFEAKQQGSAETQVQNETDECCATRGCC